MRGSYELDYLLSELKAMSCAQRSLLVQVCTVASLILVMPDSGYAWGLSGV